MPGQAPLVGREREQKHIGDLLRDPAAQGAVLAGAAGVGKTRLAQACLADTDRRVVRISATRAAASIPLGAFAPYLPPTGLNDTGDHSALRLAADALVAGADPTPPVVFVDDAHALDDASAALLLHLGISGRAFLLVTIRSGEAMPDALRDLWKDVVPRLDLEPFDVETVAALVESELGGPVDRGSARMLHDASQGNALYLRELLVGLVHSGALEEAGGMWLLRGPITAPPRLVELVTERLRGLTGRERFVLETLSLSEPLGLPVVEGLGWGKEFSSLEAAGLAEVRRNGRRQQLFVAHPLHAEVVRATMTTRRRNAILRESAAAVAALGRRRRDDARRVAMWQLEAGETADADVLFAAARDAHIAFDDIATERLARASLEADGGSPAALLLALALDNKGKHVEADDAFAVAEAIATNERDEMLATIARAANMFRGLGRSAEAHAIVERAQAEVSDEGLLRQIQAQRANFALFEGDVAHTLAITDPLLESDDEVAFCAAALPAAMIRFLAGRLDEAIDIATRAFETRSRLSEVLDLGTPGVYLVAQALTMCEAGRIEESTATAQFVFDIAAQEQFRDGMAWLAAAIGRSHLLSGRLLDAARAGRESALLFGELNHAGARWGFGLVALARAQLGDVTAAEEALADLDAEPETTMTMMDSELERARGWALAARGDTPRARALMLAAADATAERGLYTLEAALLHDIARIGGADLVADRLAERALAVDGPLMAARVLFAQAVAHADPDMLEAAAEAFEAIGAILFAAESANEAAIAYRGAGNTRAASAAAQRAQRLVARCQGARTPALMLGTDTAVLTRREREVATLAAHGMSSREIGATLYVSSRTVDNHLQRAYEKLGVSSRGQLTGALARAGY